MKTVAIVGSEIHTCKLAPYDNNEIDIWVFNQYGKTAPRVTALMQLHSPAIYKDTTNRFDFEHYDWLKKEHHYPIYMNEIDPEVPNSTRYPLEEILALYPRVEKRMFTQSACYALALALYLNYEKVLIYGIENAHYSEYSSEREGFIYWVGFLQGKGVIVERHSGDNMFDNPQYGRERLWIQDPATHSARIVALEIEVRNKTRALKRATKNGRFDKWNEALYDVGESAGRQQERERILARVKAQIAASGQSVLVPSELEIDRKDVIERIQEGRNAMERARGAQNTQDYAEAALLTAQFAGRLHEVEELKREAEKWQLQIREV